MDQPHEHPAPEDAGVDAILRASRIFIAVIAKSIADVEDLVTYSQWRILIMIATRGPQTHRAVAADLGVHPSNATRAVDKLQAAGFVRREEDPQDRRFHRLQLTNDGQALVRRVMAQRRHALNDVTSHMSEEDRHHLATAMSAFAEAAGETSDEAMRAALGLTRGAATKTAVDKLPPHSSGPP